MPQCLPLARSACLILRPVLKSLAVKSGRLPNAMKTQKKKADFGVLLATVLNPYSHYADQESGSTVPSLQTQSAVEVR